MSDLGTFPPLGFEAAEILKRHYAMREEMCAAFIEETRSGPRGIAIVRQGGYPSAREWCVPLGGRWRRLLARARLLLSPSMREHVRKNAARFRLYGLRGFRATDACLVTEPTAGQLMRVRFEPRVAPLVASRDEGETKR
jgi:hypothetical protein